MGYKRYTAQYKTRIVLEVLQGEKEIGEIAAENNLNPNMVRNWKREFLENASAAFESPGKSEKEAKKKAEAQRTSMILAGMLVQIPAEYNGPPVKTTCEKNSVN